jgi:hypothetical protein
VNRTKKIDNAILFAEEYFELKSAERKASARRAELKEKLIAFLDGKKEAAVGVFLLKNAARSKKSLEKDKLKVAFPKLNFAEFEKTSYYDVFEVLKIEE